MRIMTKTFRTGLFLTLAAALPGCSGGNDTVKRDAQPPCVIIYLVDTLRPDHLDPYGYDGATSPRLAAFARDAVLFRRAYSPSSWTKPAVASIMTSLYPLEHGAMEKRDRLSDRTTTAAERFRAAGFETAAFVSSPWIIPAFGFDRGFEHFDVVTHNGGVKGTQAPQIFDALESFWKDRSADKPLFLYIHTKEPHAPYAPPARYRRGEQPGENAMMEKDVTAGTRDEAIALYDGEIRYNDDYFGRLLDLLAADSLYDRSVIVYTADHGEEFLEHGDTGHGKRLWEELVRVPLLIKFPGERGGGSAVDDPVSLLDILPTLLDAAGVPLTGDSLSGRTLAAAASPPFQMAKRDLFMEEPRDAVELIAVRRGDYKAILRTRPKESFLLFDLARDGSEKTDIAAEKSSLAAELRSELFARLGARETGYVLYALGGKATHELSGVIRVSGEVVSLTDHNVGGDDELERSRREIRFRFHMAKPDDEVVAGFRAISPRRTIAFRTDPPGAEATFELYLDGDPIDPAMVGLGSDRRSVAGLPVSIDPGRGDALFEGRRLPSKREKKELPMEIVIGYRHVAEKVDIDERTEADLRALGYLK